MFKTNEYFDGMVKSIAFETSSGSATVGVMAKGDYEFSTSSTEYMTLISGSWLIRLPGSSNWQSFDVNETFTVPAGEKFQLKISEDSAYICRYE